MTSTLQYIAEKLEYKQFRFPLPANLLQDPEASLVKYGVLVPSEKTVQNVEVSCNCPTLANVRLINGRPFAVCPECGEWTPIDSEQLKMYDFKIDRFAEWLEKCGESLTNDDYNTLYNLLHFADRNQDKEPIKAIVVGVDEPVKTEIRSSFAAWFKGLIPAFSHKRKVYGKRPDISLERAAELAGITVDQLRTIEGLPKRKQMGYPGRNGDNLDFLEASLQLWGQKYRSAKKADKRIKKGLSNPVHHPTL